MSGLARSGAVLGFLMGCGLMLVWVGMPRQRRQGLAGRVVPYLRDTPRPSRLLDAERPPGPRSPPWPHPWSETWARWWSG